MDELFEEFLALSASLRPTYPYSLGKENSHWREIISHIDVQIPSLFQVIYSKVFGTRRDIADQKLMDFIPGYRLIHICELKSEFANVNNMLDVSSCVFIPFLGNYSSDYICYCRDRFEHESIVSISHNSFIATPLHKDPKSFFETICAFYKYHVYFLDTDGYLDYDFDLEGQIGSRINPEITYWVE